MIEAICQNNKCRKYDNDLSDNCGDDELFNVLDCEDATFSPKINICYNKSCGSYDQLSSNNCLNAVISDVSQCAEWMEEPKGCQQVSPSEQGMKRQTQVFSQLRRERQVQISQLSWERLEIEYMKLYEISLQKIEHVKYFEAQPTKLTGPKSEPGNNQ